MTSRINLLGFCETAPDSTPGKPYAICDQLCGALFRLKPSSHPQAELERQLCRCWTGKLVDWFVFFQGDTALLWRSGIYRCNATALGCTMHKVACTVNELFLTTLNVLVSRSFHFSHDTVFQTCFGDVGSHFIFALETETLTTPLAEHFACNN